MPCVNVRSASWHLIPFGLFLQEAQEVQESKETLDLQAPQVHHHAFIDHDMSQLVHMCCRVLHMRHVVTHGVASLPAPHYRVYEALTWSQSGPSACGAFAGLGGAMGNTGSTGLSGDAS